jgi:hypothetical protein
MKRMPSGNSTTRNRPTTATSISVVQLLSCTHTNKINK